MSTIEDGLIELFSRIGVKLNDGTIKNVGKWPCAPPTENDLPYILMLEGEDVIKSRSTRDYLGYPCKREATVIVETWVLETDDVKALEKVICASILADGGKLTDSILVREAKKVGPINGAVPKMIGLRTFYTISYTDLGPFS